MSSSDRVGREGRRVHGVHGNIRLGLPFTVSTDLSVSAQGAGFRGALSGPPLLLSKINTPSKTHKPAPVSFDLSPPNDVFQLVDVSLKQIRRQFL